MIRAAIARWLHNHGNHRLCHERREVERWDSLLSPVSYRMDDGSLFTPKLNGVFGDKIPIYRTYHW